MADEPSLASEQTSPLPGETTAPSPGATGDTTAPSPSAEPSGETKESLLDVVQRAVAEPRQSQQDGADRGSGASPPQVADKDKPAGSDDDGDLPDEISPEELAKLSQSAKRRINKLNNQRKRLQGELQRVQPSAQAADQVTKYLRDNDISREDFLMTLELASAMRRGDFRTFYEGVKPYMKLAEEYLGHSLPPDLQQQVQQGHMTTQAAAMYSRERMDRAMAQTNATRQQAALQQHQQLSSQKVLADQVAAAVNLWEANVIGSDPRYAAKKPAVQSTMLALAKEYGPPRSPENGVQLAQEAYRRVNEQYKLWAGPQRQATSRVPSSTGRTAGAAPEAKTLLEAVRFAREGAPRL